MIQFERLTEDSFSEFGYVGRSGAGITKAIRDGSVLLSKSPAALSHDETALDLALDFYDVQPAADPMQISIAERHEHSSQMFVPMSGQHYLVIVWDDHPAQGGKVRAFVGAPDDVVIYKPGVWHHGIISLDRQGLFASTMWRTRGGTDVEFLQIPEPFALPLQELPA